MGRIFDVINGAVCAATAVPATAAYRREAKQWASQVKVGDTWWSVGTYKNLPIDGDVQLAVEHRFTKKDWFTKQAMWGHCTAEAVWLMYGPLSRKPPANVRTFDEYCESGSWELEGATDEVVRRVKAQLMRDLAKAGR